MCWRVFVAALPFVVAFNVDAVSAELSRETDRIKNDKVEEVIRKIIERLADEAETYELTSEQLQEQAESLAEYLHTLAERPLNINAAGYDALRRIVFLTDFQIESIIKYRTEHGNIISLSELSLLSGFDSEIVELLRYFISFEASSGNSSTWFNEFYMRSDRVLEQQTMYKPISEAEFKKSPNSRYLGSPYHFLIKYSLSRGDSFKAGILVEKDAGERMTASVPFDFLSGYFTLRAIKIGSRVTAEIVAGDYKVRFGQGLTIWKGFNISTPQTPGGFYKRGSQVVTSTSSDEDNFLRGVAVTLGFGRMGLVLFSSYRKRDAALSFDSLSRKLKYTSLQGDGLHNTVSRYKKRKSMGDFVFGGSLFKRWERFRGSFNFTAQKFEYQNGRRVREDNKYQLYDGYSASASVDFAFVAGRNIFFGEVATDIDFSTAFLLGVNSRLWERWESSLLLRRYSKSYIAPNAGAYSTLSGCYNQAGISLSASRNYSSSSKIFFGADYVYYPSLRYNIDSPSHFFKLSSSYEYTYGRFLLAMMLTDTYRSYDSINSIRLKWSLLYNINSGLNIKVQQDNLLCAKKYGMYLSCYVNSLLSSRSGTNFVMSGTFFNCREWSTRLYLYERDLPQSYASQLLYGKGYKFYLLFKTRVARRLDFFVKVETLRYFPVKESDKATGSLVKVTKEPVSKIKAGIKFSL